MNMQVPSKPTRYTAEGLFKTPPLGRTRFLRHWWWMDGQEKVRVLNFVKSAGQDEFDPTADYDLALGNLPRVEPAFSGSASGREKERNLYRNIGYEFYIKTKRSVGDLEEACENDIEREQVELNSLPVLYNLLDRIAASTFTPRDIALRQREIMFYRQPFDLSTGAYLDEAKALYDELDLAQPGYWSIVNFLANVIENLDPERNVDLLIRLDHDQASLPGFRQLNWSNLSYTQFRTFVGTPGPHQLVHANFTQQVARIGDTTGRAGTRAERETSYHVRGRFQRGRRGGRGRERERGGYMSEYNQGRHRDYDHNYRGRGHSTKRQREEEA